MKSIDYSIYDEAPTAEEYILLRCQVGWGDVDLDVAQKILSGSLFHVSIRYGKKLFNMARIVGDDFMYFYIQDVVASPDYQGYDLGRALMERVERYLSKACPIGTTVALLPVGGEESFYRGYGYIERDGVNLGNGVCRFIRD